jgi:hypothetical protein
MVVEAIDIEFRLSGGQSNFVPDDSLGGQISNDQISYSIIENLFDNVSSGEASSGDTEYRCYYIINTSDTDSADFAVYIGVETPSADTQIDIGLDPAGVGDGISTGVATTIANESTAPAGVTFSHPTDVGSALSIGTLGPGDAQAIWVKRVVSSSAASSPRDDVSIRHAVDTP